MTSLEFHLFEHSNPNKVVSEKIAQIHKSKELFQQQHELSRDGLSN